MGKNFKSSTEKFNYTPLTNNAKKELKRQLDQDKKNRGWSDNIFESEKAREIGVDVRTLRKWLEGKPVAPKANQIIEVGLSGTYQGCSLLKVQDGKKLRELIFISSNYMIEATWLEDLDEEKSKKIEENLAKIEELIINIHTPIDEKDLMKVINKKREEEEKCSELLLDLGKDVSIFYAYVPKFLFPTPRPKDLGDNSVVHMFCINLVPLKVLGVTRETLQPTPLALKPRWGAMKYINEEVRKKMDGYDDD
jgi:hypothetical protein